MTDTEGDGRLEDPKLRIVRHRGEQRPQFLVALAFTGFFLNLFNLAAGYLAMASLAGRTLTMRGRANEMPALIGLPIYWLLMSLAAYRAIHASAMASRGAVVLQDDPYSSIRRHIGAALLLLLVILLPMMLLKFGMVAWFCHCCVF